MSDPRDLRDVVTLSQLGDTLRATGRFAEARAAYQAALTAAVALNDARAQAVDHGHLGALAAAEGQPDDAIPHYLKALALSQQAGEKALEAAASHQLGRLHHLRAQPGHAERYYRRSIEINRQQGRASAAAATMGLLAELLIDQPTRLSEARSLAEESLIVAQDSDRENTESWLGYGRLASIVAQEAALVTDAGQRARLEAQAASYRELQRHAPAIARALQRLGPSAGRGRVVLLWQLGRCFHVGGRADLAAKCLRDALALSATSGADDGDEAIAGAMQADLGDMLAAVGQHEQAATACAAALAIAERRQDLRGQARAAQRLGRAFQETLPRGETGHFHLAHYADSITDYVFGTDLLVDGPRERRLVVPAEAISLAPSVRPMLAPGARTWADGDGLIHIELVALEPIVEQRDDCLVVQRTRPQIAIAGAHDVVWRIVATLDGDRTLAEILAALPEESRPAAAELLAALTAFGVIDVSGRTMGAFLHTSTKKGVLPAGGLESDAVLRLATDGGYRSYPDAARVVIGEVIPKRLQGFHALTRARRSRRDFNGGALERRDVAALLHTACGVTGAMPWEGREVSLRAYPSSGALYAVEVYPIALRVEGLERAVYHYRAGDNLLEVVGPGIDLASVVNAVLPVEREMIAGAAALVCLTGCFERHERKYGQGGYRMLIAEAGHISMNMVLAATALGLSARPFGGVFDSLMNRVLGLDRDDEQFLLAVVVGHV